MISSLEVFQSGHREVGDPEFCRPTLLIPMACNQCRAMPGTADISSISHYSAAVGHTWKLFSSIAARFLYPERHSRPNHSGRIRGADKTVSSPGKKVKNLPTASTRPETPSPPWDKGICFHDFSPSFFPRPTKNQNLCRISSVAPSFVLSSSPSSYDYLPPRPLARARLTVALPRARPTPRPRRCRLRNMGALRNMSGTMKKRTCEPRM